MYNYIIHTDSIHLVQIGPQYVIEFVFPRQPMTYMCPRNSPRDNISFLALQKMKQDVSSGLFLVEKGKQTSVTWDLKEPRKYRQMHFPQKENKFWGETYDGEATFMFY